MLVRVLAAALTGAIAALIGTLVATRGDVDQLAITLAIAFAIVGGAAEWWRQARRLRGSNTTN